MPRKKTEVTKEEVKPEVKVKETKSTKTEVSIYDGQNLVRTYSKAIHGENFEKLAESFISDRPNYLIK